ncbi:MAG: PD-(D/E)XK nuclease family protein [Spirochaetales bacterium]
MVQLQSIIKQHIKDGNIFFVFPTDIVATLWADYSLECTDAGAIALERFMAWDHFKSESIRSMHQKKNSVPAPMRKFFADSLIERNKRNAFFTTLINPTYRESSQSFVDWITSLLPQLASWKEKFTQAQCVPDAEDEDIFCLEREYCRFLDDNNLFESAWEKPPFKNDGKIFYIVYPEILQDFAEYKDILSNNEHIRFVPVPPLETNPTAYIFATASEEFHKTALYIRRLCEPINEGGQGLHWSDIALSIPDIETAEPYILREFSLYNIPVHFRSAKNLTEYPAGRLFSLIQSCYNEKFSFESLKNLILNPIFPWKDTVSAQQLIEFGIQNNCLCSYDNIDIWQESFKKATGEQRALAFYTDIKKSIESLCKAKTFDRILTAYMMFREKFFDDEAFSDEANLIIGRCVAELCTLADLEKTYGEATKCSNPFGFFIEHIGEKKYLAQSSQRGVNIFPYRLAAGAPFKQHIIFESSQDALSITHKNFGFLNDTKRKILLGSDNSDVTVSKYFISLYASHSERKARFTCGEKTFSGFAIVHNVLHAEKDPLDIADNKNNDAFTAERAVFENNEITSLDFLHSIQKQGFSHFIAKSDSPHRNFCEPFIEALKKQIHKYVCNKDTGKIHVSATALNEFYKCPMQWLFLRVLKTKEYSPDAELVDDIYLGTFYHEIIRRVLEYIKKTDNNLYLHDGILPPDRTDIIIQYTHEVLENFGESCGLHNLSPLTIEIFKMQKDRYVQILIDFFTSFSASFSQSGILSIEENFSIAHSHGELIGKIDCVLDFPGNTYCDAGPFIVDFKVSKIYTTNECIKKTQKMPENFQLPFYVALYEGIYKTQVQGAGFFSIHQRKPGCILGVLELSRVHPYRKEDRLNRTGENSEGVSFEPTMEALYNAIEDFFTVLNDKTLSIFTDSEKRGCFPDGTHIPFETCAACAYKAICRTTYSVSGDRL